MPASTPRSARDAWGEKTAEDVSQWMRQIAREEAVPRDEYREILSRMDQTETRLDGVETRLGTLEDGQREMRREMNERFDTMNGRFDQMQQQFDQRLDSMSAQFDQRIDRMSAQFDQRLDKVNERLDRMNEQMRVQTRWTIGTIALIGVILSALLAIGQFVA